MESLRKSIIERLYPGIIIIAVMAICYWGTLQIAHNGDFWHHTWFAKLWGFEQFSMIKFPRPIPLLLFMANYDLFGLNPVPLHIFTLFFHFMISLFVFLLVKQLTRETFVSLMASLLYATLFIHMEVIYVTGFVYEQVWSIFAIITMVSFYYYLEKGGVLYYILSLFGFILTLLSKEGAVTVPCLLVLMACYHKFGRLNIKEIVGYIRLKENIRTLLPFFIVSGLYLFLTAEFVPVFSYGHHDFFLLSSLRHKLEMPLHLLIFAFTPCFIYNNVITEIFGIGVILSVGLVYYYSSDDYRKPALFLLLCLLFIQLPSYYKAGVHSRYLYFPAIFGMSIVAITLKQGLIMLFGEGQGVRQHSAGLFHRAQTWIIIVFLGMLSLNYVFAREQTKAWQHAGQIVDANIRDALDIISRNSEGKAVHLLNSVGYFFSPLPFAPVTVWGGINALGMGIDLADPSCPFGFNRGTIGHVGVDLGLKLDYLQEYELAKGVRCLSPREFTETSQTPGNIMLMYNPITERMVDVSGMDYESVRQLVHKKSLVVY